MNTWLVGTTTVLLLFFGFILMVLGISNEDIKFIFCAMLCLAIAGILGGLIE